MHTGGNYTRSDIYTERRTQGAKYCGGVRCRPRLGRKYAVSKAKVTDGGKTWAGFEY